MDEKEIRKILIIRLSALGDTIHTLPLAYALKKQYPNTLIDWIVEDKASKFIINNPLINKVFVIKRENRFNNYISTIKQIKKEKYDIVIDTQQLLKSAILMGFSGCKRKISLDKGREFSGIFANEIIKTDKEQFDINYHVVNRTLEIAKYLNCKDLEPHFVIPDFEAEYSKEIVELFSNLDKNKKTIIISPATTWDNKHWTVTGWAEVIKEFQDKCNIIITASEKEKKLTEKITAQTENSNIIDLTGKTSLSDLVYVFRNSDIIISPDSGSAHVAWASGAKNIITLFFATSANRTAPLGKNYYSISSKVSCSPCMKKHCRLKTNVNGCNQEIKSEEIINIVKKIIQ